VTLRILVADDHLIVRLGLVALIESEDDMKVVAQAASGREAVELYRTHRPDVSLLDLRMPDEDGTAALEAIRAQDPSARIIILTIHSGDEAVYRALHAGASGYLLKNVTGDAIVQAIRTVYAGGSWIPPDIAGRMTARLQQPPLSARELDVLKQVGHGLSNKRIADRLSLSESTVRTHVASLLSKLGADNRTHAVNVALERGILAEADLKDPSKPKA
jgi:two-component system, NarL family, response regulator